METNIIYQTDALSGLCLLDDNSIDCIVTSPPYWQLRDYGIDGIEWADGWFGQLGMEPTREEYISHLLMVFGECKRVLKPSGTLWVNIGDSYNHSLKYNLKAVPQPINGNNNRDFPYGKNLNKRENGLPPKSLCNIPGRFADEMILRGWTLRNEIIWHKPSCIPANVKDRFTVDFEKIFFFTKSPKYDFRQQFEPYAASTPARYRSGYNINGGKRTVYSELYGAPAGLRELHPQGRNKRAVWCVASESSRENHFASFPAKLIATPIEAGCPCGGIVLDIFMGSGTTAIVAKRLGRQFIGFEPNPVYVKICNRRLQNSFNNNVKKYKHEKD